MAAVVSTASRHGLNLMCATETNLIAIVLYKPLIHFNSCLKQFYISNKVVINVGVVYFGIHILRQLTLGLSQVTDK